MDEILDRFREGKFQKCLEHIESLSETNSLEDGFVIENCSVLCKAIIHIIDQNSETQNDIEDQFFLLFDHIASIENSLTHNQFQLYELKLTTAFNYLWWLLSYNNEKLDENRCLKYLNLIEKVTNKILNKNSLMEAEYLTTPEKIISSLLVLKDILANESYAVLILLVEIIVVMIMFVVKLQKNYLLQCSKYCDSLLENLREQINSKKCVNEFFKIVKISPFLFKFSFDRVAIIPSNSNISATDYLEVLNSAFLLLLKKYRECLLSIQKTPILLNAKDLRNYIAALCCYKLKNISLSHGFISETSFLNMHPNLKARFIILQGKISILERNYKDALKYFQEAFTMSTSNMPLYYIGHVYGKMGLYDMMTESFEKLLSIFENSSTIYNKSQWYNFENIILEWIHPANEIIEKEVLYALAVSYNLCERFSESVETFQKLLESEENESDTERVLRIPNKLTVLHDASITNLLAGNLTKAEEIAKAAQTLYAPEEFSVGLERKTSVLNTDIYWLNKTIEKELLENYTSHEMHAQDDTYYSERLIFFLNEDVIALLILAEVQKIQKTKEYVITLRKIYSCLCNYLEIIRGKQNLSEIEKQVSDLVKAVACKVCLRLAEEQIQQKATVNIDKMLKRALSCNRGDKDVLYTYCKFLLQNDKKRDALKLWQTFDNHKSLIISESLQSLALRYFLSTNVTFMEIQKMQKELEICH